MYGRSALPGLGAGPAKFFLRPIEQRGLDLQPRERRFAVAGCEFGVLLPRHFRQRSVHLRHHIFGDEAHLLARHCFRSARRAEVVVVHVAARAVRHQRDEWRIVVLRVLQSFQRLAIHAVVVRRDVLAAQHTLSATAFHSGFDIVQPSIVTTLQNRGFLRSLKDEFAPPDHLNSMWKRESARNAWVLFHSSLSWLRAAGLEYTP